MPIFALIVTSIFNLGKTIAALACVYMALHSPDMMPFICWGLAAAMLFIARITIKY